MHGCGRAQVFTLFKTSRTHMFLACCLRDPQSAPTMPARTSGILSVRSQQNFLARYGKRVTGARAHAHESQRRHHWAPLSWS